MADGLSLIQEPIESAADPPGERNVMIERPDVMIGWAAWDERPAESFAGANVRRVALAVYSQGR